MSEGNRNRQVWLGIWLLIVGTAALMTPVIVLEEIPSGLFAWIGAGALLSGAWLVSPFGMGGLFRQAQDSWHEFRGHDSNGSD